MWSVKNTTRRSDFRLTNGIGGAGAGSTIPWSSYRHPCLGVTLIDPNLHAEATSQVRETSDAAILPFRVVEQHATDHPECVAACRMPSNSGTGEDDPWMDSRRVASER